MFHRNPNISKIQTTIKIFFSLHLTSEVIDAWELIKSGRILCNKELLAEEKWILV